MHIYSKRYIEALSVIRDEFKITNPMKLPKITKVSLNMGLANFAGDTKKINAAIDELSLIACQKAVATYAKKSIAGFKLREGQITGCRVTLRNANMTSFLDRLIILALPRVRDFRGLSGKSMDGKGNFNLGIKEHIIFPEIDYDKIESIKGLDISISTSTDDDKLAKRLLELMGIPFTN